MKKQYITPQIYTTQVGTERLLTGSITMDLRDKEVSDEDEIE